MAASDDPDRRPEESQEVHAESDHADDSQSGSESSSSNVGQQVVQAAGQDVADDTPFARFVSVAPVVPKTFRHSLLVPFVPTDHWDRCDEDETEAGYVLEQVRQSLIRYCAPGKGQWKRHAACGTVLFMPMTVNPQNPSSGFRHPIKSHGLIRIPLLTEMPNQTVDPDENLHLKVIMGSIEVIITNNQLGTQKMTVNAQIKIPGTCIFQLKNTEWDESVVFFSSEELSPIVPGIDM